MKKLQYRKQLKEHEDWEKSQNDLK